MDSIYTGDTQAQAALITAITTGSITLITTIIPPLTKSAAERNIKAELFLSSILTPLENELRKIKALLIEIWNENSQISISDVEANILKLVDETHIRILANKIKNNMVEGYKNINDLFNNDCYFSVRPIHHQLMVVKEHMNSFFSLYRRLKTVSISDDMRQQLYQHEFTTKFVDELIDSISLYRIRIQQNAKAVRNIQRSISQIGKKRKLSVLFFQSVRIIAFVVTIALVIFILLW